jgi:hypothetical protein
VVVMGYAAGTETTMRVTDLVWKLAHVSGFSLFAASADEQAEAYATVLPLIAAGQITPAHDRSFPLGKAPEALRHLIEDRPFGKVTLTVDALSVRLCPVQGHRLRRPPVHLVRQPVVQGVLPPRTQPDVVASVEI